MIYLILNPKHGRRQTNIFPAMCGKTQDSAGCGKREYGFMPNVDALQAVQPKDLDASEIDVRLGAT